MNQETAKEIKALIEDLDLVPVDDDNAEVLNSLKNEQANSTSD